MKALLLLVTLVTAIARGEEPAPETMRQKLRAKIMESLPPPSPIQPAEEKNADDVPPILMKPFKVESSRHRSLVLRIERDEQKEAAEKFSPVSGGTAYKKDFGRVRAELGGWWNPRQGWSFLRFSW